LYGGILQLRARYLFDLAHLCGCPPPVADGLRLVDFGVLIDGIDRHLATSTPRG
jgi:hypothetical protein